MNNNKVLMIVDDDVDDRYFFEKAVKSIDPGIRCQEALHGVDALQQLRNAKTLPDYIFLDLNMPLMDGRECLTELKKDERLRNIPVIIYTTSNYHKDMELTLGLGAVFFLTKPSDILELPKQLVEAMNAATLN